MAEEHIRIYRDLIAGNRRRRPKTINGHSPPINISMTVIKLEWIVGYM